MSRVRSIHCIKSYMPQVTEKCFPWMIFCHCSYLKYDFSLNFPWTLVIIGTVSWTDTSYCPITTSNHAPNRQSEQSSEWVLGREVTKWKIRSDKQNDWCWFHWRPSYSSFGNWWFRCLLVQGFDITEIIFLPSA